MSTHTQNKITAQEALRFLKDGNKRFLAGKTQFSGDRKTTLSKLVNEQHPYATIMGCADSRVPPEIIFDADFGDLFVVRSAGNVVGNAFSPETIGTLQYAGMHLKTPLFVIMGHEGCGAIKAAVESKFRGAKVESRIQSLVELIEPCLEDVDPKANPKTQVDQAVEANVRRSIQNLIETPEGRIRVQEGVYQLVGAVFELSTGKVRFL